jgi:hypothetical protein
MSTAPQQPMPTPPSANDVLFGSSIPAAKLEVGQEFGGIITNIGTHPERAYDPVNPGRGPIKYFPSGDMIWALHVDVQTNLRESATDDGVRRIYIEGQRFTEAVRAAVQGAGAGAQLEPGGALEVVKTGKVPTGTGVEANTYSARYATPANVALRQPQQQAQQPAQAQGWPGAQQGPAPAFYGGQEATQAAQQPAQGGLSEFAAPQTQQVQQYPPEVLAAMRAAGMAVPGE